MHIYAYNNPYNNVRQIIGDMISVTEFLGKTYDDFFIASNTSNKRKKSENIKIKKSNDNDDIELIQAVKPNDVIITSTLTNYSLDLVEALEIVKNLNDKNIRIIAFNEDFDSNRSAEKILLQSSLPILQKFKKNANDTKKERIIKGIKKAAAEGKYKGRQSYTPADFPEFLPLYNKYMFRELSKSDFAQKLGVSRPTLDKLLEDFTSKKGD